MKVEKDSYKKNIINIDGKEWEIVDKSCNEEGYEYQDIEVPILKVNDYTYNAVKKFMDADIKTNIHFILSKKTFNKAISILYGIDVWNNKIDRSRLNAIVFLLFKPQGRGKFLKDWVIDHSMLSEFCHKIFDKKLSMLRMMQNCNYKLGMDSCLVNKVKKSGVRLTVQEEESMDTCEGARMSMYISPDMKMIPCSFGGDANGISLEGRSIKDVWDNSDTFKKFRDVLQNNSACCPFEL